MFTLAAAAQNITTRLRNEHVEEGLDAPLVEWTGKHEIQDDNKLWIEVKIDGGYGYIIGWTNGEVEQGFITFVETS